MKTELSINAQRITSSLEASLTQPMTGFLWEAKVVLSRESHDRIRPKHLRVAFSLPNPEFEAFSPGRVCNYYVMLN